MSKNKKRPVNTTPLSPEKYVRTQARTLPVEECLVTADWQSNGICDVIVARRHKTGSFTVGIYLVDLYCLGVKDTHYHFNISPAEFNYLKTAGPKVEKCSYALAHNIVFGSIEFAEDYGFKPHKAFAATRFILEEDDDDVELIDIEFGLGGRPFFMRGPYDDEARVNSILATLEQTAGRGNYGFAGAPEDFGTDDDDFLEADEDERLLDMFNQVSQQYNEFIRPADTLEALNNSRIGLDYELTGEPMQSDYVRFDSEQEEEDFNRFYNDIKERKDLSDTIAEIKEAVIKYPGKPVFFNLLQSAYLHNGERDKSAEVALEMVERFPGYLYTKIGYANLMMDSGRPEDAIAVFNGCRDLHQINPGRTLFHLSEASAFWAAMCRYFTMTGNADRADEYMNAILKHELQYNYNPYVIRGAIINLCTLKLDKLKEADLEQIFLNRQIA